MVDLKSKLNPSQLEAVSVINGPVLVIAGAGSGKTRVIEYRVLNLIQNNIEPSSILLLTFTRESAKKMLERATKHDSRCKNVDGGTFHSFGYKILKKYARYIGFQESFSIMDENDSIEAVHRCAGEMGLVDKDKRFPKKDTLKTIISASINKNLSIGKILEKDYSEFLIWAEQIENLSKKYAEFKIEKNLLDYDDLLVYTKTLLENFAVRQRISQKYCFIMVDEYQDTNKLQADIACLLAKEGGDNIMIVGDDAQSIYGFRGASHANIMDFPKRYKECKIIKLEENYRSTQSILNLANSVLENMINKYSKCLISARKEQGNKPRLMFFSNNYTEAEWIASQIKQLRDEGLALEHQAVLFRSSYISISLQAELSKRNIPYQVFGGLKFYETAHVKDLMAHFKVMFNPKDEVSWSRVFMLIDGVGPKTSDKIIKEAIGSNSFAGILNRLVIFYEKKFKFGNSLKKLQIVLHSAFIQKADIGQMFGRVLDYYLPVMKLKFDDWQMRFNDLDTLRQIASRYESLEELLADFAIEPPETGVLKAQVVNQQEEKPLTLSTIHSSKGLEWDCVFVLGLTEGAFPVRFSLNDESQIEEEHRLFYVAVTRAKNKLFLSLHHESNRGGISQFNKISRFVDCADILAMIDREAVIEPDFDEEDFVFEHS